MISFEKFAGNDARAHCCGQMKSIDLNCDMGEVPEHISDGTQEALMRSITSVNIACGGHAGDAQTMATTIQQALRYKLAIGAHPGYADRANFGRIELNLSPEEVADSVYAQVRTLAEVAARYHANITHVKPHGALYNQAVRNSQLARAIASGVARWSQHVVLVGLAGSPMLDVFDDAGFPVAAEAFAPGRLPSAIGRRHPVHPQRHPRLPTNRRAGRQKSSRSRHKRQRAQVAQPFLPALRNEGAVRFSVFVSGHDFSRAVSGEKSLFFRRSGLCRSGF